jgi:hypothetical protein
VTYRLPPASEGEGGIAAAALEFAGQRAAWAGTGGYRDQQGIADEAFAYDASDPGADTAGTTVWFRLSNLLVEVAYQRKGDAAISPDDQRTAVRAAQLVGAGLG